MNIILAIHVENAILQILQVLFTKSESDHLLHAIFICRHSLLQICAWWCSMLLMRPGYPSGPNTQMQKLILSTLNVSHLTLSRMNCPNRLSITTLNDITHFIAEVSARALTFTNQIPKPLHLSEKMLPNSKILHTKNNIQNFITKHDCDTWQT